MCVRAQRSRLPSPRRRRHERPHIHREREQGVPAGTRQRAGAARRDLGDRAGRIPGPGRTVRQRQDHPAQPRRLHRQARPRAHRHRRRRRHPAAAAPAGRPAPRHARLRLPDVQPHPRAHGLREHRIPAPAAGNPAPRARRAGAALARPGLTHRPGAAAAGPDVGRAAPARGHRPGHGRRAEARHRRRADGQPRLRHGRAHPRPPGAAQRDDRRDVRLFHP